MLYYFPYSRCELFLSSGHPWSFVEYHNVSRTVAEEDLTDPGWGRTGKVQVQRGVLPQNQHCSGVWWTPSTTSEHCWWGGGKYNEAQPSCTCPPTESTMLRSRRWTTECNSSAMLTRREASTPRRSRGVLVLSPSQHCARVGEVRLRYCSILY